MDNVKNKSTKIIETVTITGIWLIIFVLPVLLFREFNNIDWQAVHRAWRKLIPFLILFLVNRLFLVPYFFIKKRYIVYLLLVICSMAVFLTHNYLDIKKNMPSHINIIDNKPPPFIDKNSVGRPDNNFFKEPKKPFGPRPKNFPLFLMLNNLLFGLLVIGLDTSLKVSIKWSEAEREKAKLEKENIQNQMSFLKHQISPHFFMNTLNNIHSLIDINKDEAKETIIKLSKLMRYLLYESDENKVPLQNEVEFIQSYINLMRLRYPEKVKINVNLPQQLPNKQIHPMLFVPIIENAFKHGISYTDGSFINIDLIIVDNNLVFKTENKKQNLPVNKTCSGIGLQNIRKRLNLIYGHQYKLIIDEPGDTFLVTLTLPL